MKPLKLALFAMALGIIGPTTAFASQITINPAGYTGRYFLSGPGIVGSLQNPTTPDLQAGTYTIDDGATADGSAFTFTVDASGNVANISPSAAATGGAASLTFSNVTVDIHVQSYSGRYVLTSHNPRIDTGNESVVLIPGLTYGLDNGTETAGSAFLFQVDAVGNVAVVNSPAASGGVQTLSLNTVAVHIDPLNYLGVYVVSSFYLPGFTGAQTVNLMPGLTYSVDNYSEIADSNFLFAVDSNGIISILNSSTAASTPNNVLTFSNVFVHVNPGSYPGTYRVGAYVTLGPGPADIVLIPTLVTTVVAGAQTGTIVPTSCQVIPSTLFGLTFTLNGSPCGPGYTPAGTNNVVQPVDTTTGNLSPVTLTFSTVTQGGNTSVTSSSTGTPPPTGFKLGSPPMYYEISTTAVFSGAVTVCIDYSGISYGNASALQLFHENAGGGTWTNVTTTNDTTAHVVCGSVMSFSPFAVFESAYHAAIQPPIKADGSSVFNTNRGVVPVKFSLSLNGGATCQLPAATIALIRTAGGAPGPINQSDYILPSDNGSNFRIDGCQYVYNLDAGSLGTGTYVIHINVGGLPVGTATFGLR